MEIFRLNNIAFTELSGIGASIHPGRWNRSGTEMIYCAGSRALAMLEVLVHVPYNLAGTYLLFTIQVPGEVNNLETTVGSLPDNWQVDKERTQLLGEEFIHSNHSCILKVPSAVVPGEFNFLLNPNHPNYKKISIKNKEIIAFDERLLKFVKRE